VSARRRVAPMTECIQAPIYVNRRRLPVCASPSSSLCDPTAAPQLAGAQPWAHSRDITGSSSGSRPWCPRAIGLPTRGRRKALQTAGFAGRRPYWPASQEHTLTVAVQRLCLRATAYRRPARDESQHATAAGGARGPLMSRRRPRSRWVVSPRDPARPRPPSRPLRSAPTAAAGATRSCANAARRG
jgi:hypothetical protein